MNNEMLQQMRSGKGFIAALDQSGGSTPKALKLYGIEENTYSGEAQMFDLMHQMRTRIVTSPAFTGQRVVGAILFEQTMDRQIDGLGSAEYLWQRKNVVPFLKIDKGLEAEADGVRLMKPNPGLDALLARATQHGVFGTKMRSVIALADPTGIDAVADQQFEVARQVLEDRVVRAEAAGDVAALAPVAPVAAPFQRFATGRVELAQLDRIGQQRVQFGGGPVELLARFLV